MCFMHFAKENHLPFFSKDQSSDRKVLKKLFKFVPSNVIKMFCCYGPVRICHNREPLKQNNVTSQ